MSLDGRESVYYNKFIEISCYFHIYLHLLGGTMYCEAALAEKYSGNYKKAISLYQMELKLFFDNQKKYGLIDDDVLDDEYNRMFPLLEQKNDEWMLCAVYDALGKVFYLDGQYDKAASCYLLYISQLIKGTLDYQPNQLCTYSDIESYPLHRDPTNNIVRHLGHALKDESSALSNAANLYRRGLSGEKNIGYSPTSIEEKHYINIGYDVWISHIAYISDIDTIGFTGGAIKINSDKLLDISMLFLKTIME